MFKSMINLFYYFFSSAAPSGLARAPTRDHDQSVTFPSSARLKWPLTSRSSWPPFHTSHPPLAEAQLSHNGAFYSPTAYERDSSFWNTRWASSSWRGFCIEKRTELGLNHSQWLDLKFIASFQVFGFLKFSLAEEFTSFYIGHTPTQSSALLWGTWKMVFKRSLNVKSKKTTPKVT